MPGLRRNSYTHLNDLYSQHDPSLTRPSPFPIPTSPQHPHKPISYHVRYIPPQMDLLSSTTTQATRSSPLHLFIADAGILLANLQYLPSLFLPLRTDDRNAELFLCLANLRDNALLMILAFLETFFLLAALPVFLLLPGCLSLLVAGACGLLVLALMRPMQGARIAYSAMDEATVEGAKRFEHERWLFVNGIATGHSGLQKNIDLLAKTFGTPVVGIHNQTYGLLADILECLIQRDFSYNTMDVRMTYDYLKACLCDPTISKIVLVAHSQGGIIVSMALDYLFADLPHGVFGKLEIYTFGSAASHFNNPHLSLPAQPGMTTSQGCIPYIEHYCNEYDMVSRWGALHSTTKVLNNRYSGTVFVRLGATGHMFNQHYLSVMFPLSPRSWETGGSGINGFQKLNGPANTFLDTVVDVAAELASKREDTAVEILRRDSMFEVGNGNETIGTERMLKINGSKKGDALPEVSVDNVLMDGMYGEAEGRSVRELSRLWLYLRGRSPKD